jgi:hypothetical protein
MRKRFFFGGMLFGLTLGCVVGFGVGWLRRSGEVMRERYEEERKVVAPVLASDPAFGRIAIEPKSDGGIVIMGAVKSPEDKQRLRGELVRCFGESRAQILLYGVDVESHPGSPAP